MLIPTKIKIKSEGNACVRCVIQLTLSLSTADGISSVIDRYVYLRPPRPALFRFVTHGLAYQ